MQEEVAQPSAVPPAAASVHESSSPTRPPVAAEEPPLAELQPNLEELVPEAHAPQDAPLQMEVEGEGAGQQGDGAGMEQDVAPVPSTMDVVVAEGHIPAETVRWCCRGQL